MQKQKNKQEGITLIALVVTIVVLILLAGVSISMLVGEKGIVTQAQRAKEETQEASIKEKLDFIALEKKLNESIATTGVVDETDIFLEMMGEKEITEEDISSFNDVLQSYGKQLIAINNVSDIQKIGTDTNYPLNGLYILLDNISLQGQNWTPIGSQEEPFTGVLNGNNKTIEGLTMANPEMNAGLLGVNNGSVKNLQLTNISISSAHIMVGGIVGQNNGLIENCHVQSGSVVGIESRVGGICGENYDGGVIQNCSNAATVTAEYRLVGGICGYSKGGDIFNCENTGEIHGTYQVGGIAGDSEGLSENNISYVRDCKNFGEITQTVGTERPTISETGRNCRM